MSSNEFTDIDLEYGVGSPAPRTEHTTSGRKNLVKAIMAVAGIAAIGAVGTVAAVGSSQNSAVSGYTDAAASRHLEAEATGSDPDSTVALGGDAAPRPAYLDVPGFEKCLQEEESSGRRRLGSAPTTSTSTNWCVPKMKPSDCIDASWGQITKENMALSACTETPTKTPAASAKETPTSSPEKDATKDADDGYMTKDKDTATAVDSYLKLRPTDTPTDSKMGEYKLKLKEFVENHKAEIEKFVSVHKAAIGDAKVEIADAIKTGNFDFKHYQEQLKDIVSKHDIEAYKVGLEKFVENHKASIEKFVAENKDTLKDVADKIQSAIKDGKFDYTNYQDQLQKFVNDFDLGKYQESMTTFVDQHKEEIQKFVTANKQAVEDVQEDIDALVASGKFDFENYKEQIQALVTAYDEGYSAYGKSVSQDEIDSAEANFEDAIELAKNSEAGKTLMSRFQGTASKANDYASRAYDMEENFPQ